MQSQYQDRQTVKTEEASKLEKVCANVLGIAMLAMLLTIGISAM